MGELDPVSPWLDACAPRVLASTLVPAIALVQAYLLGIVEADGAIYRRQVCVVPHHPSQHGTTRSTAVRRWVPAWASSYRMPVVTSRMRPACRRRIFQGRSCEIPSDL